MIRLKTARAIAAKWYDGQASGLYKLCSSGHICVEALQEIADIQRHCKEQGRSLQRGDRQELFKLANFIHFRLFGKTLTEELAERQMNKLS